MRMKNSSKIAIIYGTGIREKFFDENFSEEIVNTKYGKTTVLIGKKILCIARHGLKRDIPPHMINHRANFFALKNFNVKYVIGTSSVGSLHKKIKPGSIVIPNDYILLGPQLTFFDSEIKHITPVIDEYLRRKIIKTAEKLKIQVLKRGVYFQTYGPRLETKAEISMIRKFADIVGMSMAYEATLAKELSMSYASICQVDNYAHGLTKEKLDFEKIIKRAEKTRSRIMKLIKEVVNEIKVE